MQWDENFCRKASDETKQGLIRIDQKRPTDVNLSGRFILFVLAFSPLKKTENPAGSFIP